MLVIQHIRTSWTKAARGGRLAVARGRVPHAVPLPGPPAGRTGTGCVVHLIEFGESNDFDGPFRQRIGHHPGDVPYRTTNCTVWSAGGRPVVEYRWRDGAPPRRRLDPLGNDLPLAKRLAVPRGGWVRVAENGRYSCTDTGRWWYESEVLNVADSDRVEPDLFLGREPAAVYRQLARLR